MKAADASPRGKGRLPPKLADARTRIDTAMRERGLHSTGPRRLIIDEFLAAREHVTLDDMAARVKGRDASVGLTTVYRTLRLLVECGVAEEHQFGDRMTRYELLSHGAHHDHLICTGCGKIYEFHEPRIESLQDEVATRFGFHQRTHKLEIYGECATCNAAPKRAPASHKAAPEPPTPVNKKARSPRSAPQKRHRS
jgi:Fur family ferric uptake transcriptional regulator